MSAVSSSSIHRENGIKAFIRRHPVLSMYVLMFGLAWSVLVPLALQSQGILAGPIPAELEFLAGWAPLLAAVTVSAVLAGGQGVRKLLGRYLIWRVGFRYYLAALFLMAGIILGGIALNVLLGGESPVIPAAGAPAGTIAFAFILLILAGVALNTEEAAWRGFALVRLQSRYKALTAAILLAIPEMLLHLPYFWDKENTFYPTIGIFWFSAFTLGVVFIYTYIFNRTRGSLLIVTLLHASQNAWANLLSDNSARPFYFTVALIWVIALALIMITRGQLGYQPAERMEE